MTVPLLLQGSLVPVLLEHHGHHLYIGDYQIVTGDPASDMTTELVCDDCDDTVVILKNGDQL